MRKLFTIRKITAGIIMTLIFAYALVNIVYSYTPMKEEVLRVMAADEMTMSEKIAAINTEINEVFFQKNLFIEGYGYLELLLDKDETNQFSIVKDTQGNLHYSYFQTDDVDVVEMGDATVELQEIAEANGSAYFYLMAPSKIVYGYTTFDTGIPIPDENEIMTDYLNYIGDRGVDYLDLRDTLDDSGIAYEDLFYATDHHWTTDTAFWAFTEVVDYLEENYEMDLDPDDYYTDIANYNQVLYENGFLGSLGRETGMAYSGVDDFNLIYPKFSTIYTYSASDAFGAEPVIMETNENFEGSLLDMNVFYENTDLMEIESDKYLSYLYGNYGYAHIDNQTNDTGAKILIIKDSYFVPVAAFLSTVCSEVDLIDPRWYDGDIEQYVADNNYDAVIVAFSAQNLTEEFFDFTIEE